MSKKSKKSKEKPVESKLFQNLKRTVEQHMGAHSFSAFTIRDLIQRLRLAPQHEPILHDILSFLEKNGQVKLSGGSFTWQERNTDVVTGILRVHPRGFAFLQADDPSLYPEDVFIPKHLTENAVDGDRVEVAVNPIPTSDKGPEGRVVAVVSRGRTHVAGIIRALGHGGEAFVHAPLLGSSQTIIVTPTEERKYQIGDRIVMKIVEWGSKESETICEFSHYLGHISDPTCDIKAAIEEYEIRNDFPRKALEEAAQFGAQVSKKDIENRADFRQLETFTIDPDTAKDFDDALSLTKDKKGFYQLHVHIADVSHYVTLGSALDKEAALRANSTYFPGTCIPMLPSELSNHLCSLRPNVNRLSVSVVMDFDPNGKCIKTAFMRSVIRSQKRFTYREAKQVLDGKKKSQHKPTLELMVELCGLLKKQRYERGSIEFCLPELVILVSDKGEPTGTDYVEYDITHQLVEEFMLKANEEVALNLATIGKNLTFRVHDVPAEENLKDFSLLAAAFGFSLPKKPDPRDFQKLFDEALDSPYGAYLATSYIRRMRLAHYSADNIGHYGLGLTHYCHFTSPIRRYVDLIVHRILFGEGDDKLTLDKIAEYCSDQERVSAKAEGSVSLLKKLRLLQKMNKEDPKKQFSAVITRVKPFGFSFEVLDLMLESFVHVSEIGNDYYIYSDRSMNLQGKDTGETFQSGNKITVMLTEVDLITMESKWSFVPATASRKKNEVNKKGKESRNKRGRKKK